jgi:hypothetical protein
MKSLLPLDHGLPHTALCLPSILSAHNDHPVLCQAVQPRIIYNFSFPRLANALRLHLIHPSNSSKTSATFEGFLPWNLGRVLLILITPHPP